MEVEGDVGGEVGGDVGGEVGGEQGGEPSAVGEPGEGIGRQVGVGSMLLRELATGHEGRIPAPAYELLEAAFIARATPEDLSEEHRRRYNDVRILGAGSCARCRWSTGGVRQL